MVWGSVLYQEHPEGRRPVSFASRKLSDSEKRYLAHQLEFLALKWAVVDKFHVSLYGLKLTTQLMVLTVTNGLIKATYDFSVLDYPGKANTNTDALAEFVQTHLEERRF